MSDKLLIHYLFRALCIYSKFKDTLTAYHTGPKIQKSPVHNLVMWLKFIGRAENSVDPDQTFLYKAQLFVLRFYGPVNPMGSCQARSVYVTTLTGQA